MTRQGGSLTQSAEPSDCGADDPWLLTAESVALRIAFFLARTEFERLQLFRLHLQTNVKRVSPLLLDLAAFEGVSLTSAAALMYPPQDWPARPLYDISPVSIWKSHLKKARRAAGRREAMRFAHMFTNPGVIIRGFNDPRGKFGIRPCRTVLGFTAGMGPCELTAFSSTGILKLGQPLPETIIASILGYRLGDIVDHPIFANRDYFIRRIMPDPVDDMPVIAFHAKTVAYRGNWA